MHTDANKPSVGKTLLVIHAYRHRNGLKPSVGKTLLVIHAYRRKQAFGRKNTACHPCIPSSEWVERCVKTRSGPDSVNSVNMHEWGERLLSVLT